MSAPLFSVVTAVYGVADYLPEFVASLEAQTFDLSRVEVIAVDDGSTDGSADLLAAWAERRPDLVRVVRQDNAGQAAARNHGTDLATGTWVTYPDPDDALHPDYLASVAAFLEAHPDVDLVACNRWVWDDATGRVTNTHPLRYLFDADRLVDLEADGQHFQGSAPASFFRLDRLQESGLRFDTRVRPIFEDGHFTASYLLGSDRPTAGFLGSARYHYRRRADSTLGAARSDLRRYADVLEHGYGDVVRRAQRRHGRVPRWLQTHLVFDLSWYFTRQDSRAPVGTPTTGAVAERYHQLMGEVLSGLDLDTAVPWCLAPVGRFARYVLQHGYAADPWHEPWAVLERLDEQQRLVRVTYYATGAPPTEQAYADGAPVEPRHAKTRAMRYSGRVLLRQRVLWLPCDAELELHLDGRPVDLVHERPDFPVHRALPRRTTAALAAGSQRRRQRAAELLAPEVLAPPVSRKGRLARQAMRSDRLRERYRDAWVFMDRIHDAGDSGEVLFHHVRRHHPEVNAFFVVEKDTPAWRRLRKADLGERLVAHGSVRWRVLMTQAAHLLSSHCDVPIQEPPAVLELTRPTWRFTFLEHGVIKDDLSAWLNRKSFDLFLTSTPAEQAFLAGDDSLFHLTTRECVLTGLPRFDRLLEAGARVERPDLLLVVPTWRKHLASGLEEGTQHRDVTPVLGSDFLRRWLDVLGSARLREACAEHGLRLGFLPHPNLVSLLPQVEVPEGVEVMSWEDDPQELFARTRLLLTDFSSVAFNAAYLDRPVVYYQFDEDVVLGGGHTGRQGYFDYRRDGFGPVTTTHEETEDAVLAALAHGPDPAPPYDARVRETFPLRDGGCCERVVQAVLASGRDQSGVPPTPTPLPPEPLS